MWGGRPPKRTEEHPAVYPVATVVSQSVRRKSKKQLAIKSYSRARGDPVTIGLAVYKVTTSNKGGCSELSVTVNGKTYIIDEGEVDEENGTITYDVLMKAKDEIDEGKGDSKEEDDKDEPYIIMLIPGIIKRKKYIPRSEYTLF